MLIYASDDASMTSDGVENVDNPALSFQPLTPTFSVLCRDGHGRGFELEITSDIQIRRGYPWMLPRQGVVDMDGKDPTT
jgi:hypothetical protein